MELKVEHNYGDGTRRIIFVTNNNGSFKKNITFIPANTNIRKPEVCWNKSDFLKKYPSLFGPKRNDTKIIID